MTTQQPPRCHYDRHPGQRVTREHRDDCEHPDQHRGCVPCTAPHCRICGRNHIDNTHPQTCPDCVGRIREDLTDIRWLCRHLRWQAANASTEGRLAAAAPIPGRDAMVLIGPAVTPDQLRAGRNYDEDRPSDPLPPLAALAAWEDTWRGWLEHEPAGRASITRAAVYLAGQLTYMAQQTDGPDFAAFATGVMHLRAQLERALHDEREPERGVECFECGARLVRRFRQPRPCRHIEEAARIGMNPHLWITWLASYPELGDEHGACKRQGGIDDPSVGQSWECPGCRKEYDPGEYATAVRRDLLDRDEGDGWTDIVMAAEAATTLTGRLVPASTVRKWMDRGRVGSMCMWSPGKRWGQRLVFWPDVADAATAPAARAVVSGRAS